MEIVKKGFLKIVFLLPNSCKNNNEKDYYILKSSAKRH